MFVHGYDTAAEQLNNKTREFLDLNDSIAQEVILLVLVQWIGLATTTIALRRFWKSYGCRMFRVLRF
jgi:hypothetical protein